LTIDGHWEQLPNVLDVERAYQAYVRHDQFRVASDRESVRFQHGRDRFSINFRTFQLLDNTGVDQQVRRVGDDMNANAESISWWAAVP
jgi:hypothetical protein